MKMAATPITLYLMGPTASGKSALAMALARELPLEIISVDSALVYQGMDIGTAKPSMAERQQVPHHLIDILAPTQSYSAAEFIRDARQLIAAIHRKNRIPLLVGGTMLYFKALLHGLDDLPAANLRIRQQLEAQAQKSGWPAMHARLKQVDPETASRLPETDSQRIQRALEVWQITGKPLSSLQKKHHQSRPRQGAGELLVSLEPSNRADLHLKIRQRFEAMLQAGFMQEMRRLRARGDLHAELPAMRCVGYRQAWQALDEAWPEEKLIEKATAATRQLAKRQLTWLRAMPERRILRTGPDITTAAHCQQIYRLLESGTQ